MVGEYAPLLAMIHLTGVLRIDAEDWKHSFPAGADASRGSSGSGAWKA
jgi:hypothetical protein